MVDPPGFDLPGGLAPEVYPLAWLVGAWHGSGVLSYPGIPETPFTQDVAFDHDGGPYLRYSSVIRVGSGDGVPDAAGSVSAGAADGGGHVGGGLPGATRDRPGGGAASATVADPGRVWSTESGFWRVSTERSADLAAGQHPLEVLLADPAGRVSVYLGIAAGGRIDLASDLIARTATGAAVTASKRLYGLVGGQLLWVWELAAFGHPLQSYASAQLDRI